jgi:Kip1 ubiquitination-promoting complex protein 2
VGLPEASVNIVVEFELHELLQFQSEIRKILVSLVEASARILTPSPNADEVLRVIQERLNAKAKTHPDPRAVHQLVDMGFSEHVASRALSLNRYAWQSFAVAVKLL